MTGEFIPGEVITANRTITLNKRREMAKVMVGNTGDRSIQIGSHFHFFEANAMLSFDHEAAYGMRLNIPAGTAIRFEPGSQTSVGLVVIDGKRRAHGMNRMVNSGIDTDPNAAVERLRAAGFADTNAPDDEHDTARESSE